MRRSALVTGLTGFRKIEKKVFDIKGGDQVVTKDKRRDYGSGSIFFNEKLNVWIASIDFRDPRDGRRRYRRKSLKPNARGTVPRELRDWLDEQRHRLATGENIDTKNITVAEWLTTWLQVHKPDIRPKTRVSYDSVIKNKIIPNIGAIKLQSLDGTTIQRFINEQGKKYTPRGAQYAKVVLKMSLDDAVKQRCIRANPAEYVKVPIQVRKEMVVPSDEDIIKMLEAAQKTRFGTYFLVVAASGARMGEILALRWSDLDLENKKIFISRTIIYTKETGVSFNDPKTCSGKRWIELPD